MKKYKWAVIAFLLISINVFHLQAQNLNGYSLEVSNDKLELYFNPLTYDVAFKEKASGFIWKTLPENWENDPSVRGEVRNTLASHILLDVYNAEINKVSINSYNDSLKKGYAANTKLKSGIRLEYFFREYDVNVSIEFHLSDNGFSVKIPNGSIQDCRKFNPITYSMDGLKVVPKKQFQIGEIKVLPFFDAAVKSDKGYIFIPDGCGALIEYDKCHFYQEVSGRVYGRDRAIRVFELMPNTETFRLPVYGQKKNQKGFFSIIENGDFAAKINADVAGNVSNFYRVYSSFMYREPMKIMLFEGKLLSARDTTAISERLLPRISECRIQNDINIRYYLLNGVMADFNGMADIYRKYLIDTSAFNNRTVSSIPFNLDILNALRIRDVVLGIGMELTAPMTTFRQTKEIVDEVRTLCNGQIDSFNLKLKGYNQDGFRSKITSVIKPEELLGGTKELKKLTETLQKENVNVFLDTEILMAYKEGNGFNSATDAVRDISNGIAFEWYWNFVTRSRDKDRKGRFYLSPSKLNKSIDSFLASCSQYAIKNVGFEYLGDFCYSDFRKKRNIYRDESGKVWKNALYTTAKAMDRVSVSGGNAYSFPFITDISNVPMDTSGFLVETRKIPFYQMIVHGSINYSGKPSNLRNDPKVEFLKMIEYGALPSFEWFFQDSSLILESQYPELFSGNYKVWLKDAAQEYLTIRALYQDVYNQRLVNHKLIQEGVYCSVYGNGIQIYVNYTDQTVDANGTKILPMSYAKK